MPASSASSGPEMVRGLEDDQRSALDKISDLLFQPPAGQ